MSNQRFGGYDAGVAEVTDAYLEVAVVPDTKLEQLLVYPAVACYIKLNNSLKEIYLPAETWTPIDVDITHFNIKAAVAAATGTVHWQGWFR